MPDNLLKSQAVSGVNRMIKTIKNLESQQGFPIDIAFSTVSNPPTTGEINAAFDVPTNIGTNFVGLIVDLANARNWTVFTDATSWFVVNTPPTAQSVPSPFTVGTGVGSAQININGAAATLRQLSLYTAGNLRWNIYANNTAESGANAGSNFLISRYNDAGTFIADVLQIARSTGAWTIPGSVTTQSGITNTGAISHTGETRFLPVDLTLVNGNNNDIVLPANATFVSITGPTAAFTITGIAGGTDGRVLVLLNEVSGQQMTVNNNDGASAAGNTILTQRNANITPGVQAMVTLIYRGAFWRTISARGVSGVV